MLANLKLAVRSLRKQPVFTVMATRTLAPLSSFDRGGMSLVVRAALPAQAITRTVRSMFEAVDPNVPITNVRLMADVVRASFATKRNSLRFVGAFSVLSLALGAVGLYGIITYVLSKQRRELGTRLALGARRMSVTRIVVGWGLKRVALGVTLGVLLSLGLTRFLENQLFGVSHTDIWTLFLSTAVLTGVAATATAIPALRAARIEPTVVLRD